MDINETLNLESAAGNDRMVAVMCQIDRREWWLRSSAISVTLLLTAGIASFTLPHLVTEADNFHPFFLGHAVRGLLGLVLLQSLCRV